MEKYVNTLKDYLDPRNVLSEQAWIGLAQIWEPYSVKRKEIITRPGKTEHYLYFVIEGIQRVFYYDSQEREATLVLTYPHSFSGVIDSFLLQRPSGYYFESLTQSLFLRTSFEQLTEVSVKYPKVEETIRTLTHEAFSGLLQRMVELQCFSSKEKIKKLLERSPHILQLIPHKYLASYLGIDATNFSKLINSTKM